MATLKQQSKKTIYENKVQNLDTLGVSVSEFVEEESINVVESVCLDFIERVQKNIENEKDMITTGKISDITIQVEGNDVNIFAYPHLIYQDKGVNGAVNKLYNTPFTYKDKIPPIDVIKQWLRDKKIVLRNPAEAGQPQDPESEINKAAWAISKKIYRDGFKPRNIFEKEIPQLIEDIQNNVADLVAISIVNSLPDNKTI